MSKTGQRGRSMYTLGMEDYHRWGGAFIRYPNDGKYHAGFRAAELESRLKVKRAGLWVRSCFWLAQKFAGVGK